MNLSDFTLLKEDDNSYTVGHPQGKSITVTKRGLSDKAQTLISKLKKTQNFDDGGSAQPADPTPDPTANIEPEIYTTPDTAQPQPEQAPNPVDPSQVPSSGSPDMPGSGQPGNQAQSAQPAQPPNQAPAMPDLNAPLIAEQKALQGGVAAQQAQGLANAAEIRDFQNRVADETAAFQKRKQAYDDQDAALTNAVMNKKIDPNRYWNNKSTGSKISAGIAMILGGMGAAKTGGANPATQFIQDAIHRDIEAQKNDQSQSMNLWKMNREKFATDQEAHLATVNQMLAGLKANMMLTASQYQGAQATANAAPTLAAIGNEMAQNNYKKAFLGQMNSGQMSTVDPARAVPIFVPPDHQKQALTEVGQGTAAVENEKNLLALYDQAAKDTRPATGMSLKSVANAIPGYHPQSIRGLTSGIDPLIYDNEGRVNEREQNDLRGLFPKFGDSDETVAKNREAFQSFINHKKQTPTLNAFGINLNNFKATRGAPANQQPPIRGRTADGRIALYDPITKQPIGWEK